MKIRTVWITKPLNQPTLNCPYSRHPSPEVIFYHQSVVHQLVVYIRFVCLDREDPTMTFLLIRNLLISLA